ncbi:MAG TPA: tail fiber domain-containing protein [Parafilimonas sp.]|nr:tail fiber domain-containing protein [Parafilimonas sp.]
MKISYYTTLGLLFMLTRHSFSQTNVFPSTGSAGIGTTTPDASSIVEMKSTTQGMLIPRMSKTQRDAIGSPATGLMIFQTNSTPGFYYYSGTAWTAVFSKGANTALSNLKSPTAVNVDILPDSAGKRNFGAGGFTWNNIYFHGKWYRDSIQLLSSNSVNLFFGDNAGLINAGQYNTAFGLAAFSSNKAGQLNTAIGYQALSLDSTGFENTAVGSQALYLHKTGGDNSAIGSGALLNSTTGYRNTALGAAALYFSTTGYENVAIGYKALGNSTGFRNTATGPVAMNANTSGYDNVATGDSALYSNHDGSNNAAVGNNALHENISGIYNTAAGFRALYKNDGFRNTALGNEALSSNTSGNFNTSVGDNAGSNVKTGSNNIFIGAGANCGTTGAISNSTVIGSNAVNTVSNSFVFGDANITGWGFGVGAGARAIKVGSSASNGNGAYLTVGGTWTSTSARSKKEDFQKQDENLILQKINQLDVTKWKYKGTKDEYHYGPMADDFHRLFVVGDDSSTSDMDKTGVLFLGMQQLIKLNDEKDAKINDLQKQIDELKAMIVSGGHAQTGMNDELSVMSGASLQQNIPNPFNHTTTINYLLPEKYSSAKMIVTDNTGKVLKEENIAANRKGSLSVDGATLASGAYQYSLYVDGRLIDSKQMLLSR